MKSRNKGITLIGLVITIVIMLILTSISINLLFGDNGIITKAKLAKKERETAEIKEKIQENIMVYNTENAKKNQKNQDYKEETLYGFWELFNGENEDGTPKYPEYYDPTFIIYLFEEGAALDFTPTLNMYSAAKTYSSASVFYKGFQTDMDSRLNVKRGPLAVYDLENEETDTGEQDEDTVPPIIVTQITATPSENNIILNVTAVDAGSGYAKVVWYHKLSSASEFTNQTETTGENVGKTSNVTATETLTDISNGTYDIYAKVYDVAGNFVQTETVQATVFYDNIAPVITLNSFTAVADASYIDLSIAAIDTISGLQRVEWYHRTLGGEYLQTVTDYEDVGVTNEQIKTARLGSLLDGTYEVYAKVYDVAGNQSETTPIQVVIDTSTGIRTEGGSWSETEGVNVPKITNGMVPVRYDTATSNWVVCSKDDQQWFNYKTTDADYNNDGTVDAIKKQWANVMLMDGLTVFDEGTSGNQTQVTDVNYNNDEVIGKQVANMGSMFVWIPRYAYCIRGWNSKSGSTYIGFLQGISSEGTFGTMTVGTYEDAIDGLASGGTLKKYVVHPAFEWDLNSDGDVLDEGEQLEGIWIAKFVTNDNSNVRSLPNELHSKDIYANCFDACRTISTTNAENYGFINESEGGLVEAHLMKNVEWGATVYLANSTFGVTPSINKNYDSTAKVNYTGYGSGTTDEYKYNGTKGIKASTTGNVYGIYDMSGVCEIVAARLFYNTMESNRFVDYYLGGNTTSTYQAKLSYENAINKYGDAIYETSSEGEYNEENDWESWGMNGCDFMYSAAQTYLKRGGFYNGGNKTGMFYYSWSTASTLNAFRAALAIK